MEMNWVMCLIYMEINAETIYVGTKIFLLGKKADILLYSCIADK